MPSNACTIFLCADDNRERDQIITLSPGFEREFTISYKEPGCMTKRWNCDASALFEYIHTVFASLLADNSIDQVAKIQISTPLFPSFLIKTFTQPKNIETIRDLLLKQLALFIRTDTDGRTAIAWPYGAGTNRATF